MYSGDCLDFVAAVLYAFEAIIFVYVGIYVAFRIAEGKRIFNMPRWAAIALATLMIAEGIEVGLRFVKRIMAMAYGTHALGDGPFILASATTAALAAAFYLAMRRYDELECDDDG